MMANSANTRGSADGLPAGDAGHGLHARRSPGPISRRRLIGAAAIAGLGAAVLDSAAASASQGADTQQAQSDGAFSPATVRVIQAIIASGVGAASVPGINVGIWIPGRGSYVLAGGVSDVSTAAPMTLADHVRIASITKDLHRHRHPPARGRKTPQP